MNGIPSAFSITLKKPHCSACPEDPERTSFSAGSGCVASVFFGALHARGCGAVSTFLLSLARVLAILLCIGKRCLGYAVAAFPILWRSYTRTTVHWHGRPHIANFGAKEHAEWTLLVPFAFLEIAVCQALLRGPDVDLLDLVERVPAAADLP